MRSYPVSPRQQSGVALIVVLMFLILIMIAGAIAVRQSRVDLRVATVDQVNTLTLNASDSVLAYIEQAATDSSNPSNQKLYSGTGVLGYFLVQPQAKVGHQITFCYRPTQAQSLYERSKSQVLYPQPKGGRSPSTTAVCDPTNADDYTSKRGVAMTQVHIQGVEDSQADNFEKAAQGTSDDRFNQVISPKVHLTSTSVLPAMSDIPVDKVKECLARPVGNSALYDTNNLGNISSCLKSRAIPTTSLVQEATVTNEQEGGFNPNTGEVVTATPAP